MPAQLVALTYLMPSHYDKLKLKMGKITHGKKFVDAAKILLDSCISTRGETLQESLDSFTFIHNVSYSLYENQFGFLQNLLGGIFVRGGGQGGSRSWQKFGQSPHPALVPIFRPVPVPSTRHLSPKIFTILEYFCIDFDYF